MMKQVLSALIIVVGLNSCQTEEKEEMGKVNVGDMAPDFELKDKDGNKVKLSSYRGEKSVVVYFYPKDETPGCTAQACRSR